jgi:hypothetical protein
MSLFKKYLFKRLPTAEDEAKALTYYRSVPPEILSNWLNSRKADWFEAKQKFPGLRPDANGGNHPQEFRMRLIETQIRLIESALLESEREADFAALLERAESRFYLWHQKTFARNASGASPTFTIRTSRVAGVRCMPFESTVNCWSGKFENELVSTGQLRGNRGAQRCSQSLAWMNTVNS